MAQLLTDEPTVLGTGLSNRVTITDLSSKSSLHDRETDEQNELDKLSLADAREAQNQPEITELASYIKQRWSVAYRAKQPVQLELYEASLQRQGRYTDDKLAAIREQGGSEVFMGLTSVKCRACESWLDDAYSDYESIWNIKPTPIPDLPPNFKQYIAEIVQREVMNQPELLGTFKDQEEFKNYLLDQTNKNIDKLAKETAERMKLKMQDQMTEAGFKGALKECRSDITTYKAGFLKGPIVRRKKQLTWQQNEQTDAWEPVQADSLKVCYERVSPFSMYPSPSATNIDDGDMIEHHRLSKKNLTEMKGVPSYNDEAINLVLEDYDSGNLGSWMFGMNNDYEQKAERPDEHQIGSSDDIIDAVEFWGDCQGKLLRKWGLSEEEVPDEYESYQINAWLIGSYIIKAMVNPDKEGKKPYYKASFESIPGKFWGRGIPELMKDIQESCNATIRALINNEALSSGPFIMVDESQMVPGQDYENLHPHKIFYYDSTRTYKGKDGISFNQPKSNAAELLAVYNSFQQKADEYTGIPAYTYGMGGQIGGGGRTATGLSMLMQAASKGIKFVLFNIDTRIISPAVEHLYIFNMQYSEDESIKGDLKIVAKGALSLVVKEQLQIRRTEFLNMVGTNPIYSQILGKRRIAYLLRDAVLTLEMPTDDIIPSDKELEAMEIAEQKMQQLMLQQQAASQQTGVPGQGMPGQGTPPKPRTLDMAGQPAQGMDAALFTARPE